MVAQLSYPESPSKGFAGMLAEQFSMRQLDSYVVENGPLKFGQAVERGSDPMKQVVQLADVANFMGISVAVLQDIETESDQPAYYADKQMASIMDDGRIYVIAGGAVAVGDEVVPSTGADTKFTTGTGTSNHKTYARSSASADGDLLLVEMVGPQG